jgi:CubicO group peptidase (beta-lactamase class C family)
MQSSHIALFACVLSAALLTAQSASAATPDSGFAVSARIDKLVHEEVMRQKIPGAAVAVIKSDKVIKAQGYGLADIENDVSVTPETIFQSGSLAKQFTAMAVMLLVEGGQLSLADTLTKFFPDAPESWRTITIRHLLTHTSGLMDYFDDQELDLRKDYTEDQFAKLAYGFTTEFSPGARWSYSNTNYVLIGIIIHKVSGVFYGDLLAERVFKPTGMKTARVISEADIVPHRASGYRLVDDQIKNQEWVAPSWLTTADGSLYFSLQDLLAWDTAVRARAILKPESWQEILSPVTLNSGKTYPYGFGWFLDERGGKPLYNHGGGMQGFTSWLSHFVKDDLTVIVLANLEQSRPDFFIDSIAAIFDSGLTLPELKPIEDREPAVAVRLMKLLEDSREGKLDSAEFSYTRGFSYIAEMAAEILKPLGAIPRPILVDRREEGDDVMYKYDLNFSGKIMRARLGIAPDSKISSYWVSWK